MDRLRRVPCMADVMIKCPVTGVPVATGIGMDFESLKNVDMRDNTLGDCPSCGQDHVWQKKDAFPDS